MEKTILLGYGNQKFSLKAQRGLYFLLSAMFTSQGILTIFRYTDLQIVFIPLGVVMLAYGLFSLFAALTITSEKSVYSPKVRMTDDEIVFRLRFFKANTVFRWADIIAITLMPYSIIFELTEGVQKVRYQTSASISKEIKEVLSELAETKGIDVDRG